MKYKHSLDIFATSNKLVVYLTNRIQSIPNYQQLKGTLELTKFIANCCEAEINNENKKDHKKISKRNVIVQVLTQVFGTMSASDLANMDDQLIFLLNNKMIKSLGYWKSLVKSVFGTAVENMVEEIKEINSVNTNITPSTVSTTNVTNHYYGPTLPNVMPVTPDPTVVAVAPVVPLPVVPLPPVPVFAPPVVAPVPIYVPPVLVQSMPTPAPIVTLSIPSPLPLVPTISLPMPIVPTLSLVPQVSFPVPVVSSPVSLTTSSDPLIMQSVSHHIG